MDFILLSIGGQWGKTVQWGMYVKIGAQRLKKCSEIVFCNMLRTYYVVSKQLDVLHSCSLIKILQILLVLITMSILTSTGYKYISLGLLIICFSLIIYIIASEFLKLKNLYADLKIACSLQDPSSSSPSSS